MFSLGLSFGPLDCGLPLFCQKVALRVINQLLDYFLHLFYGVVWRFDNLAITRLVRH